MRQGEREREKESREYCKDPLGIRRVIHPCIAHESGGKSVRIGDETVVR